MQADIARRFYTLVGEVTEVPSDKVITLSRVCVHRLLKLVGGRSAVAVEMADPDEGPFARAGAVINVDYSCEAEARGSEMYLVHNNPPDPALNDFLAARGKTITMVRDLDDREWYRSAHYDIVRRPYDMDHSLYCRLTLPDGQDMAVGLQRCPGDPIFSERDKSLVHLLHTSKREAGTSGTTRRLKSAGQSCNRCARTLQARCCRNILLQGDAEKEVAAKLKLSPHTVHRYTQTIYGELGMHSRAELLAKYARAM